jgi:hypothetical protein
MGEKAYNVEEVTRVHRNTWSNTSLESEISQLFKFRPGGVV